MVNLLMFNLSIAFNRFNVKLYQNIILLISGGLFVNAPVLRLIVFAGIV